MRRARGVGAGIGWGLFARLAATHLLAAAGVLVIAILIAQDRLSAPGFIILSFLVLGVVVTVLAGLVARGVSYPLLRIRQEIERAGADPLPESSLHEPRASGAIVSAVNRLATDLARHVDELRAETALREQILSSMDQAVLLAEGTSVVYANQAARELFDQPDMDALPPAIPIPGDLFPITKELTLHHPATREIRCTSARVGEDTILVVAQDVTEAKRTERIRRDFVANASHELKTPVAAILATAETLRDAMADDPETATRFAERLTKEAMRLSNLVQDLLSLARLEQMRHPPQIVELGKVVAQVLAEMRPAADAKSLAVTDEVDAGVTVQGGEEDLALMVRNLLDNAIQYTPNGGSVSVRLARGAGRVDLTVSDTGIGIPERDLPRIFERFYRVDKARSRETGGTGLGLAIVRHVAENHGGAVGARSELGAGSVFTVTLPLAAA